MYMCLVCGFPDLDEPPRDEAGVPSYEICPSCGFEYGFDDDHSGFTYAQWRAKWIEDGMQWWSSAHEPSAGWNAAKQLKAIDKP
jgi:hypothetical protein